MIKKIEHVGIAVKDLNKSNSLFKKLLGEASYKTETVEAEAVTTSFFKLGDQKIDYYCELKYDGASINLLYKNGGLESATTRGDGIQGDDVTNNIKTISSIP